MLRKRNGLNSIEILTVLAIFAVLVALLLPAIQMLKENMHIVQFEYYFGDIERKFLFSMNQPGHEEYKAIVQQWVDNRMAEYAKNCLVTEQDPIEESAEVTELIPNPKTLDDLNHLLSLMEKSEYEKSKARKNFENAKKSARALYLNASDRPEDYSRRANNKPYTREDFEEVGEIKDKDIEIIRVR